jgi:hypothetical protein
VINNIDGRARQEVANLGSLATGAQVVGQLPDEPIAFREV